MRKKILFTTLFVLFAWVSFARMQGDDNADAGAPVVVVGTETVLLTSEINHVDYRISVALPPSYNDSEGTYPVLYVLDPQVSFLTVTEATRFMSIMGQLPELIIVGVGYPTEDIEEMNARRQNDYYSAQAPFLRFIEEELLPLIEAEYRIDATDQGLIGYSYGGQFAYHVLLNRTELFKRYLIIDAPANALMPYLMRDDADFRQQFAELDVKLVMTATGEETISAAIQTRDYEGLDATGISLGNVTHEAALHLSLAAGIMALYAA